MRSASSLLVLVPITGWCGAPFQTDDPEVVGAGRVEVLAFYQGTLTEVDRSGSAPGVELHFGLHQGIELDVVAARAFSARNGGGSESGFGDTTLGVKYQLIPESDASPLVSLDPKVTLPTGNAARGLGNGGSQVFLALAAEKKVGGFETYGNAGYWINNGAGNLNYGFLGWQAQYQFSEAWVLGAEIFRTTAQTSTKPPSTGFNVGGYYFAGPRTQLLFSAGRGLQNASTTNRVSTYFGIQLGF